MNHRPDQPGSSGIREKMRTDFYDDNDTETWLHVLGEGRHYHFGNGAQAVRDLYGFIPEGARVLDCGCGWGGPGALLVREKHCAVSGVTISRRQRDYIATQVPEMDVVLADLDQTVPGAAYDLALFIESMTHLLRPVFTLQHLNVGRVVIRDFVGLRGYYFDPAWGMSFYPPATWESILASAGLKIVHMSVLNNADMLQKLNDDGARWLRKIAELDPARIVGQMQKLEGHCRALVAMRSFDAWSPIVICADRR